MARRRLLGGNLPTFDEARVRERAERLFDRGISHDGAARQRAARIATGSVKNKLESISAATLVIHGSEDPFGLEHGLDAAMATVVAAVADALRES